MSRDEYPFHKEEYRYDPEHVARMQAALDAYDERRRRDVRARRIAMTVYFVFVLGLAAAFFYSAAV